MTQLYFIFMLILLLSFSIFNARFEKKHDNKSIFDEQKVKNTIQTATMVDGIARVVADISLIV